MNTSMKKLTILGLCSGLGDMIGKQAEDDELFCIARRFKMLADNALAKSNVKITRRLIDRVREKIDGVYRDGEEFDALETLSLCLLGLMDLQHHSGKGTPVDALLMHAMYFTKYWDPELQDEGAHAEATRKYLEWLTV